MFIDWLHRSDLSAHDFLEMKAFSTVFECIRYKRGIFHVVLDSINSFDVLQFWRKNLHLYLSPKKKYIYTHTQDMSFVFDQLWNTRQTIENFEKFVGNRSSRLERYRGED